MSKQKIVIVEQSIDFVPLLQSALDSYGYNGVDVVSSHDDAGSGDLILDETEAFLQKPISMGRLMQNLDLLIARDESSEQSELGPFSLDKISNLLTVNKTGQTIKITEKERDILLYLKQQAPATVSRQDLLEHVWGYGENINTHTLETHIYRLRQKIEENASAPVFLITNDEGYRLEI